MTGLIRWISTGQVLPGCSGPQNPEHAIQYGSRIFPGTAFTIRPSWFNKHWFENLPLGVADIHGADYEEISLGATLLLLDILREINHFQRTRVMRWVLIKLVFPLSVSAYRF